MPHEEKVETINLGTEKSRKELKIKVTLTSETKKDLITLLNEYSDVKHKIPLTLSCKPIKHKLRKMKLDMLVKKVNKRKRLRSYWMLAS
ncbi:hypothetical protein PTKIN_Ptkin04bG0145500 [Pterospermum kingtungense]